MFHQLDEDKSGTLNINEIKNGMQSLEVILKGKRSKTNAAEYKELMMSLDKNGDGIISYDEFIAAAIDKVALLNQENIMSAFKLIDSDNSGYITIEELKAAFDADGDSKDSSLWIDIMIEVDKDGDNKISPKEFIDAMTQVLKKQHETNRV